MYLHDFYFIGIGSAYFLHEQFLQIVYTPIWRYRTRTETINKHIYAPVTWLSKSSNRIILTVYLDLR